MTLIVTSPIREFYIDVLGYSENDDTLKNYYDSELKDMLEKKEQKNYDSWYKSYLRA